MKYYNNSNPNFKNSRLFTSREFDEEIGFYYYRARYYDAKTGKIIQRDPIDISDDVNLYVYVGNNPVNFVDPSGMKSKSLIINFGKYMDASIGLNGSLAGGSIAQMGVSTYMLRKFMYGDRSSDYYGNNHWISKKLMKTDFYKDIEKKSY